MNEPIKVLLKYTFALDSVLRENSIQAGLGGVGLPTAIKDLHEVITNGGDMIAVQVYLRLTSFVVIDNLSVCTFPVAVLTNGGVHFTFDLTHESVMCEQW